MYILEMQITLVRLVAKEDDGLGYITYVFQCLEKKVHIFNKYIMCVRYPNWCQGTIEIGDVGYLHFKEVFAGIDKWFNGVDWTYYKYDAIQFLKFVKKPKKNKRCKYVL